MQRICLVACAKTKRESKSLAKELYVSSLFHKSSEYAQRNSDKWYILSAKHGLLNPYDVIAPYEQTLNNMGVSERRIWSNKVLNQLLQIANSNSEIIFLAGIKYRELLIPNLSERGYNISVPLKGLSIGNQLKWLKRQLIENSNCDDLEHLYHLIDKLEMGIGGKRILGECSANMNWPKSGLYILFEPTEYRALYRAKMRIVRVGTHAVSRGAKSTLWGRLRTHRGTDDGRGSHRSSIFRLHIGNAILRKTNQLSEFPTWGHGQNANREVRESEAKIEKQVSAIIRQMSILWLDIDDKPGPTSDRAFIERNLISLLSSRGRQIDPPSPQWLGFYSPRFEIKNSGLWNLDYLYHKFHPRFLEIFQKYIEFTTGKASLSKTSLAPPNWPQWSNPRFNNSQLNIFGGSNNE